jgi:hypothetical protein
MGIRELVREWLRRLLGVPSEREVVQLVELSRQQADARCDALEGRVAKLAETVGLVAQQVNHNTVMLHRWANESATLNAIERKAAAKVRADRAIASGSPLLKGF